MSEDWKTAHKYFEEFESRFPSVHFEVDIRYRVVSLRYRAGLQYAYAQCSYAGIGDKVVAASVALELLLNDPIVSEEGIRAVPIPITKIGFGRRVLRYQPDPSKRGFTPK